MLKLDRANLNQAAALTGKSSPRMPVVRGLQLNIRVATSLGKRKDVGGIINHINSIPKIKAFFAALSSAGADHPEKF